MDILAVSAAELATEVAMELEFGRIVQTAYWQSPKQACGSLKLASMVSVHLSRFR